MMVLLDKNQVAERLGVQPKTAAVLMMEMHPIAISGKQRKRYRVTEASLEQWLAKKVIGGKRTIGASIVGSKRRLERR